MAAKSSFDAKGWAALAIQANYDNQAFARLCGVSPRQLQRIFRSAIGCSPQSWLNALRVMHAQELLGAGKTVKEVAGALGFRRPTYFSFHFKVVTGITPSEFRFRNLKE